jgi:hypothetical protein
MQQVGPMFLCRTLNAKMSTKWLKMSNPQEPSRGLGAMCS